jgi:hypothetical protein
VYIQLARQYSAGADEEGEWAMFISVRRYTINNEISIAEIARRAEEGFVPIIRQTPGFVAYYGVASGANEITTVSVFEDQAGADESNRRAADWVRQNLAQYVSAPPQITAGEVRFTAKA